MGGELFSALPVSNNAANQSTPNRTVECNRVLPVEMA